MIKANDIKTLIEQHDWAAARNVLDEATTEEISAYERLFLEGLLAAKQADWHTAKGYFLQADEIVPKGEAAEMLDMITDIYDFYYKDNLNP